MDVRFYCHQLSAQATAIEKFVDALDSSQAQWKPSAQDWSILEVVNHLLDEEREDFRARIRHLFSGSVQPWLPIAPLEWVRERAYNSRDLEESVKLFLLERRESVDWLSLHEEADWDLRYSHPPLAGLAAGDLLVAWAAHDLLHTRQIIELRWNYAQTKKGRYSSDYAGEW
jgi:hypothetical protein